MRALGQTTRIERSTVEQVRARIAYLREKTKEASNAKSYDFEKRLAEVREREAALREEKKAAKKALRERAGTSPPASIDEASNSRQILDGFGPHSKLPQGLYGI